MGVLVKPEVRTMVFGWWWSRLGVLMNDHEPHSRFRPFSWFPRSLSLSKIVGAGNAGF